MPLKILGYSTDASKDQLRKRAHSAISGSERRHLVSRVDNQRLKTFLKIPYAWEPESLSNLARAQEGTTFYGIIHNDGTAFAAASHFVDENESFSTIQHELVRDGLRHETYSRMLGLYDGVSGQTPRNGDVAGFSVLKRGRQGEIDRARSFFNCQFNSKNARDMPNELVERLRDELGLLDDDAAEEQKIEVDVFDSMIADLPAELKIASKELFDLCQIAIWRPVAGRPALYEESLFTARKKWADQWAATTKIGFSFSPKDQIALQETKAQYRLACNIVLNLSKTPRKVYGADHIKSIIDRQSEIEFRKIFEFEQSKIGASDLKRDLAQLTNHIRTIRSTVDPELLSTHKQIRSALYILSGMSGAIPEIELYEAFNPSMAKLPISLADCCRELLVICESVICKRPQPDNAHQIFLNAWRNYRLAVSDAIASGLGAEDLDFLAKIKSECQYTLQNMLSFSYNRLVASLEGSSQKIKTLFNDFNFEYIFCLDERPADPELVTKLEELLNKLNSCPPALWDTMEPALVRSIKLRKNQVLAALFILDGFPAIYQSDRAVEGTQAKLAALPAPIAAAVAPMHQIDLEILWTNSKNLNPIKAKDLLVARGLFLRALEACEASGQVLTADETALLESIKLDHLFACQHQFQLGFSGYYSDLMGNLPMTIQRISRIRDGEFEKLFEFGDKSGIGVKRVELESELAIFNSCPVEVWTNLSTSERAAIQAAKSRLEGALFLLSDLKEIYPSERASILSPDCYPHFPDDFKASIRRAVDIRARFLWTAPSVMSKNAYEEVLEIRQSLINSIENLRNSGFSFGVSDLEIIKQVDRHIQKYCAELVEVTKNCSSEYIGRQMPRVIAQILRRDDTQELMALFALDGADSTAGNFKDITHDIILIGSIPPHILAHLSSDWQHYVEQRQQQLKAAYQILRNKTWNERADHSYVQIDQVAKFLPLKVQKQGTEVLNRLDSILWARKVDSSLVSEYLEARLALCHELENCKQAGDQFSAVEHEALNAVQLINRLVLDELFDISTSKLESNFQRTPPKIYEPIVASKPDDWFAIFDIPAAQLPANIFADSLRTELDALYTWGRGAWNSVPSWEKEYLEKRRDLLCVALTVLRGERVEPESFEITLWQRLANFMLRFE